ncbi:hypothetical protein V3H26_22205 [Vibrio parahaemolyticus]|uniref:hypothetical protein n=1 Tax=Vibrio parahaemolyticus TaxID=670 RepID=UPI00236156C6|nr:hypothetical protein [Vibrio parahaemolyticus]HCE2133759.1 hypothetical protein [Vibrio parahaemolyticus]
MGRYLRDEAIKNVTVNEDILRDISDEFLYRAQKINNSLTDEEKNQGLLQIVSYVIRFDNKGYRFYTIDELLKFYKNANNVERVIICMESQQSRNTGREFGCHSELRFDSKDPNNCWLSVSSDEQDWVESAYSAYRGVIATIENKNGIVRTSWTTLVIQIGGVIFGFLASLVIAKKISPLLTVDSPFVVSFLFVLLIYSNLWMYLNQLVLKSIDLTFPNVKFQRKNNYFLHWTLQAVVGGIIAAFVLYLIGLGLDEVKNIVRSLVVERI